jgi:hypothetical protein
MEIKISLGNGVCVTIGNDSSDQITYPTSGLQKGLLLVVDDLSVAEEAVGFGVPVLKKGLQTFFPGKVELTSFQKDHSHKVTAAYTLCRTEKISGVHHKLLQNYFFYCMKNSAAALMRRVTPLRGLLSAVSGMLRGAFRLETVYEDSGLKATIIMHYSIEENSGVVNVEADTASLDGNGVTEVIIMNEQGAHYFDCYRDSSGIFLKGDKIGMWDEVRADEACFESSAQKVFFSLGRENGARLYRGRELVGSRLAWSGFGYSFKPRAAGFRYAIKIGKVT